MITKLNEVPSLSASWLAPLKAEDPDLYQELAASLIIAQSKRPEDNGVLGANHSSLFDVLGALDLVGKEIGGFEMPQPTGSTQADAVKQFSDERKREFETDADLLFVGSYPNALIVSMENQIGLMDLTEDTVGLEFLAPNFDRFIVAQANAYDVFKRTLVDDEDEDAYWAGCKECLEHPAFEGTDVERIFFLQLKG